MGKSESIARNKIVSLQQAETNCQKWKLAGEKIVFTNGVFDLLHAGHIQSLMSARDCGDRLVIGLNADASVKRLKGESRPVIDQHNRALLLASLFIVDAIVFFEEDTPINLIQKLLPDVLVKSADYNLNTIVGAKEVIANGGEVKIMPLVAGLSSTNIINKIKNE